MLIAPLERLDKAAVPSVDASGEGLTDRQNGDVWDTGNTALLAHGVGSSSIGVGAVTGAGSPLAVDVNEMGSLLSAPLCTAAAALYLPPAPKHVNM